MIEFSEAQRNVPEATEGEAKRLLMNKLPEQMVQWVVEKQDRRNEKAPIVCFNAGMAMSEGQLSTVIKTLTREVPTKIVPKENFDYWLTFGDEMAVQKVIMLNKRKVAGHAGTLSVRQVEDTLTLEEICHGILKKIGNQGSGDPGNENGIPRD